MRDQTGASNPNWRGGGRTVRPDGYRTVYAPQHPRATNGRVLEHWLVAEKAIGKYLPSSAVVHHVDSNEANNRNDNLVICESQGYHRLLHARQRVFYAGGKPGRDKICGSCKKVKPMTEFFPSAGSCKPCAAASLRQYRKTPSYRNWYKSYFHGDTNGQ